VSRRTAVLALVLSQTAVLTAGATVAVAMPSPVPAPVVVSEQREAIPHPTTERVAPRAVAKPKPKPKPVAKPRPKPRVRRTAVVRHSTIQVVRRTTTTSLTPQQRMMRAVDRLPGYRTGEARWVISSDWGHWGVADLANAIGYISPTVPADRMYDVVAHEWSHMLSVKAYGGDVTTALAAMNRYFGGSDLMGAERAADCMARLLGATWTHYTSCTNAAWRDGARRLLARQRL
jgi:hypothetical protein